MDKKNDLGQVAQSFATDCDCGITIPATSGHLIHGGVEFLYRCPHCGRKWWDTYEFVERERI